ncbi:phage tail assembly protein [Novosphingobium sp. 9]|uniref:phage tail assembly protein n=1 Tax=Novosphingobium sp. 9 TaxID=2025349 RepID=UPI0021B590BC|nr:phage tail assembly protein [Novosphingobium sp. 9]
MSDDANTAPEAEDLPETLTITLRKPVEHNGLKIDEIMLREPTADEWKRWDGLTGAECDITAVSTVAGIPLAAAHKLGVRDLLQGSRYIGRFLD